MATPRHPFRSRAPRHQIENLAVAQCDSGPDPRALAAADRSSCEARSSANFPTRDTRLRHRRFRREVTDMAENGYRELRLAVLIDADNVSSKFIKEMMEEVSKYGTPTFKRIYGDWTNTSLSGWKQVLNEHAISPVQQFSYTSGKNSTDSALIIDAMDILYTRRVDGFFIVSSDSDFTRLATRLREEGARVFGMGQKKTPPAFIKACDKFIYIEILAPRTATTRRAPGEEPARGRRKPSLDEDDSFHDLVRNTLDDLADEDGWVFMGQLGNGLLRKRTDFDPRNYGFSKLTDLVESLPYVEVLARQTNPGGKKHPCVRLRD